MPGIQTVSTVNMNAYDQEEGFQDVFDAFAFIGSGPGVPKQVFKEVYCGCPRCGFHMTRRIYKYHRCNGRW
jgi:hypothetical protein